MNPPTTREGPAPTILYNDTRPQFYECGCCVHWHRADFTGDCRDDDQRFTTGQLDILFPDLSWLISCWRLTTLKTVGLRWLYWWRFATQ